MEYIWLLVAYLLGSIPFGLILTKINGHGDIRQIGSGNIGATNVLRTGNKWLALSTLMLDALKGWLAVYLCQIYAPSLIFLAGLIAIIGHVFPVWLKLKGGKGVATALGVLLALNYLIALATLAIWVISARIFKISSLSALVAVMCVPFLVYFMIADENLLKNWLFFAVANAMLILWTHRDNIKRLANGEESAIKL